MQLGIVTIQKNRGPWLVEWLAFHHVVGFRKFYFYAHLCKDETLTILARLARLIDITITPIEHTADRIQLTAYQHACNSYLGEVDWMAFIDGDEFLFPSVADTMQEALQPFLDMPASALGVYNYNFGSSGHITEPAGLITDNYLMRAPDGHSTHRRVKSLVRGRQDVQVSPCSNVFATSGGTVDELMRPIHWGYMPELEPSYIHFRFNHYVCQSFEYYLKYKKFSGAADAGSDAVRELEWWNGFDTNQVRDVAIGRFRERLRETVARFEAVVRR